MKRALALLLAIVGCTAQARNEVVAGVIQTSAHEISLYKTSSAVMKTGQSCGKGWRDAAIYPIGKRSEYVFGCWIMTGDEVLLDFEDGDSRVFKRSKIIPAKLIKPML